MREKSVETYGDGTFRMLSRAAGVCITCLLAGCTFYDGNTTYHMGYVKIVEVDGSTVGVESKAVRTIGVRVGDGIGIGYFDEKRIAIPLDCRLVIIVQTKTQLDEMLRRLEGLQRRELCVAIES